MSLAHEDSRELPPVRINTPPSGHDNGSPPRRLRTACDYCHHAKVRCSGGTRCARCQRDNLECFRSYTAKMGKPKGTRARKSTARMNSNLNGGLYASRRLSNTWSLGYDTEPSSTSERCGSEPIDVLAGLTWLPASSPEEFHPQGLNITPSSTRKQSLEIPGPSFCPTPGFEMVNPVPYSNDIQQQHIAYSQPQPSILENASWTCHPSAQQVHLGSTYSQDWSVVHAQDPPSTVGTSHFGSPLTPESGQDTDDEAAVYGLNLSLFPTPPTRHGSVASVCSCLQKQASQLGHLHVVEQQQPSIQYDTMLHYTSQTLECVEQTLQCSECKDNFQVLLTSIIVFQIVFRWAESVFCVAKASDPECSLKLSMGSYDLSEADSRLLGGVLCSRTFEKSKQILELLQRRIDETEVCTGGPNTSKIADAGYLRHSCHVLAQSHARITRQLCCRS